LSIHEGDPSSRGIGKQEETTKFHPRKKQKCEEESPTSEKAQRGPIIAEEELFDFVRKIEKKAAFLKEDRGPL